MKHIFLALFLIGMNAYAVGKRVNYTIVSSSNNIPTSADSTAGSKVVVLTAAVEEIKCYNGTATPIYINVEDGTSASAPSEADDVIAASNGMIYTNKIGGAVYIWSTGSAISSGSVYCAVKYK